MLLLTNISFAQNSKKDIIKGNDAYKKKQYKQAVAAYQDALKKSPENTTAYYNLGNALYKTDKPDYALKAYDYTVQTARNNDIKENAYYNGGVALQKQNKLPECIKAYKNALKLAPQDEEARQNLERALMQLKQQQNKDQQNKDQQKHEDKKNNEQPKPQPSKISKQDAEEKLKSLLDHEKELQDKLHKVRTPSPDKPKKDW